MSLPTDPKEILEVLAGERCPCGHPTADHEPPDPEFKVGTFVEKTGACRVPGCECKGVIE